MCSRPRCCAKQRVVAAVALGVFLRADEVDPGAVPVVDRRLPRRRRRSRRTRRPRARASPTASSTAARASLGRRPTRRRGAGCRTSGSPSGGRCRRPRDCRRGPRSARGAAGSGAGSARCRRESRAAGSGEKLMPASTSRTPCEHLLGGEQVDAAELVVVAPVAPGRAFRALLPPLRHGVPPPAAADRTLYCTDRLV